ncbi:STAS domain-containing protein [Anoxynatronum buryatiense]|uniref:Anti-sigma factor antagonist n=1 Tax=Anoxynatronum buryatiense TaxID=489973 RepID=A0AA45WWB0_9CLOT|nr:STAS domain-containing protein [Anoxynatronum buryatiense]SMP58322.1 anti-sigma B factor antagonist [Anoxynatronum buryatiense]
MALKIQKSFNEEEQLWVLVLEGEVDLHTAGILKKAVNEMLEEKKGSIRIMGDQLEYIDSTGLSVFIGTLKQLQKENLNILVRNLKPSIKKLLNITGLDKILVVEN